MSSAHDRHVAAATLAALPHITPVRLRRLLGHFGDPVAALEAVMRGRAAAAVAGDRERAVDVARAWRRAADPEPIGRVLAARGTHVWIEGDAGFPFTRPVLDQPCVLFGEGDQPGVFDHPRAAVVGTRSATPHGLADAYDLGEHLARAGATVVSGMAIGVDGAVHEGAVAARGAVVGVVATGLDVEYPRRHASLYRAVREHGVVVGEHWYGVPPDKARFPVRNRIIAALADVVAVVEATTTGGARHTARAALDYGRGVLAMPGSRRNAAAAGCNQLLADGAHPLLQPSDLVVALELAAGGRARWRRPPPPPGNPDATLVLRALAGEPATVDDVIVRTGLSPGPVARALRDLERGGCVERRRGFVWPR
jgi:DNA processing protein